MKSKDRIGSRFSKLVIQSIIHKLPYGGVKILAKCDCGNTYEGNLNNILSGRTISCGCYRSERFRQIGLKSANALRHGMSKTSTYAIWSGMKRRCNVETAIGYEYYGGRGIKVCDRWLKFENFLEDMGERPKELSIERINNDGNYEPNNCKWATSKEQQNNKRKKFKLAFK